MAVTVEIKAGTRLIMANQIKLPRFADEYKIAHHADQSCQLLYY